MRLRFLFFMAAMFASAPSFAASVDELKGYFKAAKSGSYEFKQTAINPDGFVVNSNGFLAFQRPSRFRVEYISPDKMEIVSNGDELWVYDIALNQVLVAKQDEVPSFKGFLSILTSSDISSELQVSTEKGPEGIRDWLVLQPLNPDEQQFKKCSIAFNDEGQLISVRVVDLLDTVFAANFVSLDTPAPQPQEFEFVIPDGAEVIRNTN